MYCNDNPVNAIDPDGQDWYTDKDGTRQYDPKVQSQKDLAKGQTYIGDTYQVKDKNGTVIENYRNDGSILFTNSCDAFTRMVKNSIKKDVEEFAAVTKDGVLITPDYKNKELNSNVDNYGYSFENGNLKDKDGTIFQTEATIHTHFAKDTYPEPSGRDAWGIGDIQTFSKATPNKPFLTMGRDGYIYGSIGYYDNNRLHWADLPYSGSFRVYQLVTTKNYLNRFIFKTYKFK